MSQIVDNSNISIEEALQENVRWGKTIWFFTLQGVFAYFTLKQDYFLALKIDLPPLIISLIVIGFLYGCVSNFIMCYFVKLTGKFFNTEGSYKNILKAFSLAYLPHLYTVALIVLYLTIAHFFESSIIQENMIALIVIMPVLKIAIGILAIWTLVRLVKNLTVVQNITVGRAILNFLAASVLYVPIYYLLVMEW
ncbi:hypothetical protein AHMF7605_02295 [Adhaeribacter arboris]|uniref:Yip1 domain-containing protein n=1 Tax=Adhaeribacter arboris TaxID=2072846 RepID=A0A2T2YAC2_9BACT|nr:YIP1 family protein [Adhaeribacter arboris]PSR52436.1 hypothetical protein AHMF7605_02295 [Adhaeribacter arboris]